jgi:hypothetical protein
MDKDHWNTSRWHAPVIIGSLAIFVVALFWVSWLIGRKEPPARPGPVSLKVVPAAATAEVGAKTDPAVGSASAAARSAPTISAAPTPTPVPVMVKSPGGAASIALAPEDDPALVSLPSFIPAYPGSRTVSCTHSGGSDSTRGSYVFATPDGPDVVGSYYKDQFTSEGLVVSINVGGNDHKNLSYTLIADGGAAGRSVSLRIDYQEGRSHGSIGFVGK